MGIYGSLSNNNYSFEESAELDEIFEDTVIGESAILLESLGSKIPKEGGNIMAKEMSKEEISEKARRLCEKVRRLCVL